MLRARGRPATLRSDAIESLRLCCCHVGTESIRPSCGTPSDLGARQHDRLAGRSFCPRRPDSRGTAGESLSAEGSPRAARSHSEQCRLRDAPSQFPRLCRWRIVVDRRQHAAGAGSRRSCARFCAGTNTRMWIKAACSACRKARTGRISSAREAKGCISIACTCWRCAAPRNFSAVRRAIVSAAGPPWSRSGSTPTFGMPGDRGYTARHFVAHVQHGRHASAGFDGASRGSCRRSAI